MKSKDEKATILWIVDEEQASEHNPDLVQAASLIRNGELVAFPTETVYGLGANALSTEAVDKIFKAKGRPSDNPLIVHIARMEQLEDVVSEVTEKARKCMEAFWPGPITFVLPAQEGVASNVTAGLKTVGVRMPDHPVARLLIQLAELPVAAPSANVSGRPSPTTAQHVWEDLHGRIAGIVDGGSAGYGVESTVVDMTGDIPVILRPGGITVEQLKEVIGEVRWDPSLKNPDDIPMSPGMKYTHYAPKGKLTLIGGEVNFEFISTVNKLCEEFQGKGERVGILTTEENASNYKADVVLSCGTRHDIRSIAAQLYDSLREFDEERATIIFSETFPEEGIGLAVMNRLRKAAGGRTMNVN